MRHALSIVGWSNLGVSLLWIVLAIPLVLGRVPRNRIYGYRTHKSLASDANWDCLNRYCGKAALLWNIPFLLFSLAAFLFNPFPPTKNGVLAFSCLPFLSVLGPVVQTLLWSRKI